MACLLHLPLVKVLMVPLETGAQAWAHLVHHYIAPSDPSYWPQPYSVLLISHERFETQYAGRRPLPRRALLNDLKQLKADTFVALDLDISPVPEGSPGIGPTKDERGFERDLYEHIMARPGQFLLILPFPVQDNVNRNTKAEWLVRMCRAGVTVTDPRIERTLGVVTRDLALADLSFAHFIRLVSENPKRVTTAIETQKPLDFEPGGALCHHIAPGERAFKPQEPPEPLAPEQVARASALLAPQDSDLQLDRLALQQCNESAKPNQGCVDRIYGPLLSFGKGHTRFTQFSWCAGEAKPFEHTGCSPRSEPPKREGTRVVIFGGDYDLADRFATPLGERTGAYVHAISAQRTLISETHLGGLLMDFGLGLLFGLVAHAFWELWFDAKRRRTTFHVFGKLKFTLTPQTSWLALALLAVSLSALTVLALLLAAALLVYANTWLSPIPIVIGMALDAMVLGSAGVAAHKMVDHSSHARAPRYGKLRGFEALASQVPRLIWIVVIAYVLVDIALRLLLYLLLYLLEVHP